MKVTNDTFDRGASGFGLLGTLLAYLHTLGSESNTELQHS